MATPDERFTVLETEVAGIIEILFNKLSEAEAGNQETIAEGLMHYAKQVGRIAEASNIAGFVGFQDICMLFQEALHSLYERGAGLSEEERERLEEWPTLVMSYLESPEDEANIQALIGHLQDPVWITPLPQEYTELLQNLLTQPILEQNAPVPSIEAESSEIVDKPQSTADELEATGINNERSKSLAETTSQINTESTIEQTVGSTTESTKTADPLDKLHQEIAALIDCIPAEENVNLHGSIVARSIERYGQQIERIGAAAAAADLVGLQDLCLLFQENLNHLINRYDYGITKREYELLAEWPTLAIDYLETPEEARTGQALIAHLQNPDWRKPLPEVYSDVLAGLLTPKAAVESAEAIEDPSVQPLQNQTPDQTPEDTPSAEDDESQLELDTEEPDQPITAVDVANPSNADNRSDENGFDSEELEADEAAYETTDLNELDSRHSPITTDASTELIQLVQAEIVAIADTATDALAIGADPNADPADRKQALESYADEIQLLSQAAESLGLLGLNQVCLQIENNIRALAGRDATLTNEETDILEKWPALITNYLAALESRECCQALATYLRTPIWPEPLSSDESAALIETLIAPTLSVEEGEIEVRPKHAQPDDVSLRLPEDVNPELLDSLLQELPNQTAEFSAAIQHLTTASGTYKDLDVAQRIAHTIKGAANTVGVKGIANLTHHLEDIFVALSKHNTLPTSTLREAMMDAADCLETMSESLLGMCPPPTQAQHTLQAILDWANRIDQHGIPNDDMEAPAPRQPKAPPTEENLKAGTASPVRTPTKAAEATSSTVPMLRVPAPLIDDLLRLVGETIIQSGQIQEHIRLIKNQSRLVRAQNRAFQQLTAELEQLVDIQGVLSEPKQPVLEGNFDPLEFDQYNELHSVTHRLIEAATDARNLDQDIEDTFATLDTLLIDQGQLHRENQEAVLRTRMVPVKTIVPRLQRSVRQTCRLTDKEVSLTISGDETLMDSNILSDLVDPLMHILRNAVDHGIEATEIRQRLGKPQNGCIDLSFLREGNTIIVRCRDDGAGLDLDAIRSTAKERGLLGSEQTITNDELLRLILQPGFSTRTTASQTSGRGVGLDVVYSQLLEMKGAINLHSEPQQGCTIELRLPVTLLLTHALLVRARKQIYAISDRGIEQILYPGSGEINKFGHTTTYQVNDEIYQLSHFENLLNLPSDRRKTDRRLRPVVLVQEESGLFHAITVEEVIDSRDIVVKGMGRYISKLHGILGATILGDGSVVTVLDLPELLRAPKETTFNLSRAKRRHDETDSDEPPVALIVDDSLSARRSLAQFVKDAGFDVRTAHDGLEAISILEATKPSILLVDLEMPRMNGLELTSHVRALESTRHLPVIMITSRSTEKHRREATSVGVNAYLTKPFAEDELLKHIHTALENG